MSFFKKTTYFCLNFLLVISFLTIPLTSWGFSETTIGGNLVASVNPRYPKPEEMVTIRLNAYGYNIENATISWFVNKKLELSGIAKKEHSVRMGPLGSSTIVTIVAETSARKQIIKNLTFKPGEIDLIWEADTYIPAGYEGAALPSLGSRVTVTAIPNFRDRETILGPTDLVFTWKQDFKTMVRESGRGKDSYTFTLDRSGTQIEVLAESSSFGVSSQQKATIIAYTPELILYPIKPLVGETLEALSSVFTVPRDANSLKIEPYYTPNNIMTSKLVSYEWTLDKKPLYTTRDQTIPLEKLEGLSSSTLSVKVSNVLIPLDPIQKTWRIIANSFNPFFNE